MNDASQEQRFEEQLQQMALDPEVQAVFQRLKTAGRQEALERAIQHEGQPKPSIEYPPVSCICPTYGRTHLLEEAIQAFLNQDYPGEKELVIVNDYARQTLEFDHPDVRVVNIPTRFHSVGEKYKAAVAMCNYDVIFVWHDDDISLRHRLTFSITHFDWGKGFFKADRAFFWNNEALSGPVDNIFHGGSCWLRQKFVAVNGYPHIDFSYDTGFEALGDKHQPESTSPYQIDADDVYYIYRWQGLNSYHLSTFGDSAHQDIQAFVEEQARNRAIPQGQVRLQPHWNSDYSTLVEAYLAGKTAEKKKEERQFPPPKLVIPPPPEMADTFVRCLFKGNYPLRISVIIPALNESVLLQRTVEQFATTLPHQSEIIVVDNGSNDGCADFLTANPKDNITLIQTTEALGVAGARNRGLEAAKGEIVVFADAHIDIPEHWWQPIATALQKQKVGVAGPGIGVMGTLDHPTAYGQRIAGPNLRVEWLTTSLENAYPVPTLGGGFMAMRHDTLKTAGAFDQGMPQWGSEDLELCIRYWLLGYEVHVVPEVLILHYFRSKNPYLVEQKAITHNILRVAFLHFNQERIARVIAAMKNHFPDFDQALAATIDSDVWQQRAKFAACRQYDDDWLFEKFKDICPV